jgi:hypothetical protein
MAIWRVSSFEEAVPQAATLHNASDRSTALIFLQESSVNPGVPGQPPGCWVTPARRCYFLWLCSRRFI